MAAILIPHPVALHTYSRASGMINGHTLGGIDEVFVACALGPSCMQLKAIVYVVYCIFVLNQKAREFFSSWHCAYKYRSIYTYIYIYLKIC